METDVLIVGGGLSGLALASHLERTGRPFLLCEARGRLGGRVLSHPRDGHHYDLGPAWFWPGQPRMAALVDALSLPVFEQYASGRMVFQDGSGAITRHIEMATMAGSLRIDGGLGRIIEGLSGMIGAENLLPGHQVTGITRTATGFTVQVQTAMDVHQITASTIVLALPPRIAAEAIRFDPPLPDSATTAMRRVPTWMAGHAKVVAIYDTPFWREAGLNGDAMSHTGPLAEVHDASPADASSGALFGFVSTPPAGRRDASAFKAQALAHLVDLFGPEAGTPKDLILRDWAFDRFTAVLADQQPPAGHPAYGMPAELTGLCDGGLHFASSEMGATFGGFLEGALEAAEAARAALAARSARSPL